MSDGPHRSLPLPVHWRRVARNAAREASSNADVAEEMDCALRCDFRLVPVGLRRQSMFASENRIADLGALSGLCRIWVEQKQRFANGDPPSLRSDKQALASALRDYAERLRGSMVEHWLGKEPLPEARRSAVRMHSVCLAHDYDALAAELLQESRSETRVRRPRKQSGVDEGPGLP